MKMRMDMAREVYAIFIRWNRKLFRQPVLIFFTLIQPLVWFLLFTQAFSAIGSIPGFALLTGTSSYVTFYMAAVIIQTIASSALNSGIGLVNDIDNGFMDKMRVAPISKASILFGRLLNTAVLTIIQVIIILIIGFALGIQVASGFLGILLVLVIAALFGIGWSGISLFIALTTKSSETTLTIGLLTTFPLLFLSASVMPLQLLPSWVQTIAIYNPFTYIAQALQSLIITGFVWDKIAYAFITILIVGVITLGASITLFRKKIS
jgi:ABC-2 type transport system permease protein